MRSYVYRIAGVVLIAAAPSLILGGDRCEFALGDIFIVGGLAIGLGGLLLGLADILDAIRRKQ